MHEAKLSNCGGLNFGCGTRDVSASQKVRVGQCTRDVGDKIIGQYNAAEEFMAFEAAFASILYVKEIPVPS